jgi:single-strand DNA-binding protein
MIVGKLNKSATTFKAGESTGFGVSLGKQFYNRDTKEKEWTNYRGVVFAKSPKQIEYYTSALVEGAIIELNGSNVQIKDWEGKYYLEIIDCQLGFVYSPNKSAPTQGFNQPAQQSQTTTAPPSSGFDDFDDDIAF